MVHDTHCLTLHYLRVISYIQYFTLYINLSIGEFQCNLDDMLSVKRHIVNELSKQDDVACKHETIVGPETHEVQGTAEAYSGAYPPSSPPSLVNEHSRYSVIPELPLAHRIPQTISPDQYCKM